MPQDVGGKIIVGGEHLCVVRRQFRDAGGRPRYEKVQGEYVLIAEALAPRPTIMESGDGWFYEDLSPIPVGADLGHVPEPYRTQIRSWLQKTNGAGRPEIVKRVGRTREPRPELEEPDWAAAEPDDPEVKAWMEHQRTGGAPDRAA
jgi:hypothetical protein